MSEQPYDPYIPSGSNAAGATAATQQNNGDPKTREIDRVSLPGDVMEIWLLFIFSINWDSGQDSVGRGRCTFRPQR